MVTAHQDIPLGMKFHSPLPGCVDNYLTTFAHQSEGGELFGQLSTLLRTDGWVSDGVVLEQHH